jgi:superfamily I DNA and RNA helicase
VLDRRQENNARKIGEGHRIIYGVAGSGKTVLLIARATLSAASSRAITPSSRYVTSIVRAIFFISSIKDR